MTSPFLQQTRSFSDINVSNSPEILLRALNKFSNDVASAVNSRTIGLHSNQASITGNTFNGTQTSRIILYAPSLLIGTTTIASTIQPSPNLIVTSISGIATNGSISIPIPYINVSNPADSIGIFFTLSTAAVSIQTTTSNWSSYKAFITLEFGYVV